MTYSYLPYNKELNGRARELRNNMTRAEKKLWYEFLKMHRCRFLRQKPIDNYIVDFYCSEAKLIIELDGESHLGEINERYDEKRTAALEGYGLKVLRFWNNEVHDGFGAVCERIEECLPPFGKGG